ncbi:MAG TPA: type I glyceraldehyde-3-phosphate dehydrogenase [Candidatus Diapherotrites archaeon]|uniref:glyceraldehyde-3-phosphate dehydrogenase (NAD(P)(+)) (phosphorylating) n=1 Tax=Candidatus Iainarchaeum sp. TaxID=3101447 RepID=A0A7J4IZ56_9ARCH|nr:type I glyceraldehyde-3-phosphate dehydrogenase [Candidatus Diapherotrites archaeon]
MVRVAINGFGRIGRLVLRCGIGEKNIEWVINHPQGIESAKHLLKYDSVYGKFDGEIRSDGDTLIAAGKRVKVISVRDKPEKLPWKELRVDVVIESTGVFRGKDDAGGHIRAGAAKVIISAPAKGDIESYVLGVNTGNLGKSADVIDNASCTTNCLMPVLKVLNDKFKIKRGFMTTIHAYTSDQNLVDGTHDDPRRARSAALNIIPTKTGASEAAAKVIPGLKGKIDGKAIRVPVPVGSLIDVTAEVEKATSAEEINAEMKKASEGSLKGILEYSEDPLVSSDIIGNKHSSVFDSKLTKVIGGNLVQVVAWYDNEMGYSQRIVDVIKTLKM